MCEGSLNRLDAAEFVSRTTGHRVAGSTLTYWEARSLLRRQRPGRRVPSRYFAVDLVAAVALARLRRGGACLRKTRRAMRELRRLLPNVIGRPGARRFIEGFN